MGIRIGICRAAVFLSIIYWLCVLSAIIFMVSPPGFGAPGCCGPGWGGGPPLEPPGFPPYPPPGGFYMPPIDPLSFFFCALGFYLFWFGVFWVICGFFTWGWVEPVVHHEHKHKYDGCGGGRCGC